MVFDVPGWAVAAQGAPPTWGLACSPAAATVLLFLTLLLGAAAVTLGTTIRGRRRRAGDLRRRTTAVDAIPPCRFRVLRFETTAIAKRAG